MAPTWLAVVVYSIFVLSLMVRVTSTSQINIETCDELISTIADGGASFKLLDDITCSKSIIIDSSMVISIAGEDKALMIGDNVTYSNIIYTQGSLEIANMTITSRSTNIIRGIHNEGDLLLKGCEFEGLNIGSTSDAFEYGGAVSD